MTKRNHIARRIEHQEPDRGRSFRTGRLSAGILCSLVLLLLLGLSGCTTYDNFKEAFIDDTADDTDTISIGIYEPLAGADKAAAEPEVQGIELAHKLHPTVNGKKVKLIYADNNSDIDAAETAITTLLTKNPAVILGSYGALYSLLAGEYNAEAQVPAIAITNTNPLVTRNNSYYFRICYIDSTQGRLLARYLEYLKADSAGVLLPEGDDAAMAMATAFTNQMEEGTDKDNVISYYRKYTTGEKNFSSYLKDLEKTGVKYVFLPGETTDAINIINQAAALHMDVTFLGDMTWGEETFSKELSAEVDPGKLAFVQFFASNGDDQKVVVNKSREAFLKACEEAYGKGDEVEESVALGYDAYMIALDAIEKAEEKSGSPASGEQIRDLLLSDGYQFEGASGIIEFNRYGDPKKTAYISTWQNNAVKAIYTIEKDKQ